MSAASGNLPAQSELGEMYENGEGVERNLQEAVRLYSLASQKGFARAHYLLGKCYENGIELEVNIQEATRLYFMAIKLGVTDALPHLDAIALNGLADFSI